MPKDPEYYDTDESYFDKQPDEAFEAAYKIGTQLYEVTIKGEWPEEGSNSGYYLVAYSDGTTKIIDYIIKTGWVERGVGPTAHAAAIGQIIENHFA